MLLFIVWLPHCSPQHGTWKPPCFDVASTHFIDDVALPSHSGCGGCACGRTEVSSSHWWLYQQEDGGGDWGWWWTRVVVRVLVMDGGMVVVERNHCGLLMAPNQALVFADAWNLATKRAGSWLVLGNGMGYPGVFHDNLCLYLSKPVPIPKCTGFYSYGSRVGYNPWVSKPIWYQSTG